MTTSAPFPDRLQRGMNRIDKEPPGGTDAEALPLIRKSLERTAARVAAGIEAGGALFRFQVTGGKPVMFMGKEPLPLEPNRIFQILNTVEVGLQPGEIVDLDGNLAAWQIRLEVNLTDTNLRQAETTLKGMKQGRDRDHAAAQSAESTKIRLRTRMTQLVTALGAAQKEGESPPPLPAPIAVKAAAKPAAAPPPPPPAAPAGPAPAGVVTKALRKIVTAVELSGHQAVVLGDVAHVAWGSNRPARQIELLVSSGEDQREWILSAARGEGLRAVPGGGPLNLQFTDDKLGGTVHVDLLEAATPFLDQVLKRAQPRAAYSVDVKSATCEDLILLRAGSEAAEDRASIVELLKLNAARIDGAYLKKEAEQAWVFDQVKSAWAEAKK